MQTAQPTLQRLLDANTHFALDARGTTNHCPMALVALARMGASPERLQEFFDRWTQKYAIEETAADITIGVDEWPEHIGNRGAFSSLQRHFTETINASEATGVIRDVFSRTPFAPATGAFHALIRIGYGIEAEHAGEIAAGLAAYVSSNLPIAIDIPESQANVSIKDALAILSDRLSGRSWQGNSITARLKAVGSDHGFRDALCLPRSDSAFLDNIARTAIELYWQTSSFTVLHMVTGAYAARIVLTRLPDELAHRMLRSVWVATSAAYVSVGAPRMSAHDLPSDPIDWPEVLRRAIESDDDHVIKMAYTCFREGMRDPDPHYFASASRIVAGRRT